MTKLKRFTLLLIAVLMAFMSIGCQPAKKPEEGKRAQQGQKQEKPKIPGAISQGEGKEPRLRVYLTDSKEIKEMDFEQYLMGVVAGEMKNNFPEEALAAQAILARTFVMEFVTEKGESKYKGAHVSTDIEEAQAWNAEEINDRVKKAVEKTRGQVAIHNNNYIRAWFHAHSGGKTATAKEGLGFEGTEPPYIHVVDSLDSKKAPKDDVNWTATFTKFEIQQALQKLGKNVESFNSIEVAKKGPSGRVTELKIGEDTVPAPAFRVALDSTKMKSTKLNKITVSGDKVTMSGVGYGHGVGMSQWGAYEMAEKGKSAEEIVQYYFKDVEVVKLWQ